MALKSFIISKLDHQMSKSWKRIVAHAFETIIKFDMLKNWVCTWLPSSGQDFGKNFLDSKHVLKVYFKPSMKNPDFFIFTTSLWACLVENSPLNRALYSILLQSEF